MKKFLAIFLLMFTPMACEAVQEKDLNLEEINAVQTRIDNVGTNILNHNKITRRIVFTYDKRTKKKKLTTDKALTKRQIIIYDGLYNSVQTDDELAALISREISTVIKSYDGVWGGTIDSVQVALSSKKFETAADKRAVALFSRLKGIGFRCCLISNNQEPRVEMFNRDIKVDYVYDAHKPSTKNYVKAMEIMGTDRSNSLFIGDQLFTDVWGAKRAGIRNILVKPIHPKEEIQIVLKRYLERIVLYFYKKSLR